MDDTSKLFIEISKNLGEINTNLKNVCDTIAKHEMRITQLEQKKDSQDDFKTELLKLMAKAVVIGLVIIASLTGSASIIAKLFG